MVSALVQIHASFLRYVLGRREKAKRKKVRYCLVMAINVQVVLHP